MDIILIVARLMLIAISCVVLAYWGFKTFKSVKKKMNKKIMWLYGKIIIDKPLTIEVFTDEVKFYFDDGKKEEYNIKDVFNIVPSREKTLSKFMEGKYGKVVFFNDPEIKLVMKSNYSLADFSSSSNYQITSIVYSDESSIVKGSNSHCNIFSFEQPLQNIELSRSVKRVHRNVVRKETIKDLTLSIGKDNALLYDSFFNVSSVLPNKQYNTVCLNLYTPVEILDISNINAKELRLNIHHSTLSVSLEKVIQLASRLSVNQNSDNEMSIFVRFILNEVNYYNVAKFERDFKNELSKIGNNVNFKLIGEEKTGISIKGGKIKKYIVNEMSTSPRKLMYLDGLVVGYEDD